MTAEWKEVTDPEELFKLKLEGWEIQVRNAGAWLKWGATSWSQSFKFRARPQQPNMKKVKMLAYFDGVLLVWRNADYNLTDGRWVRVPAEDKEIEVPCA